LPLYRKYFYLQYWNSGVCPVRRHVCRFGNIMAVYRNETSFSPHFSDKI